MHDDVPLVVPEINAAALDDHRGIIANPNCTTTGVVMALEPIRRAAGLESVVITTLQAVSGAGREGIDELDAQQAALAAGDAPLVEIFAAPIAGNVVPLCESLLESGYSTEEMKLINETRKILALPELRVTATCVRVPVAVGHSSTLLVEPANPIGVEEARRALSRFPGVEVVDDLHRSLVATPLDVVGRDEILVGRVRKDLESDRLWLWQVGDNLRQGAATNAVQIAEALIERKLLE
jgi:aspartate-semialdehyde dehydrogenase